MTLKQLGKSRAAGALLVLLFALGAFVSSARATAQQSDIILIEGKEYPLLATPLEPYLVLHPNAFPKSNVMSTGLWRGYIAAWTVDEDGKLLARRVGVLVGMSSDGDPFRDVTAEMFGEEGPVIANWYTGYLIVPTGKLSHYVHMGFASLYRKYLVMRVEQGVVVESVKMKRDDFIRFREAQFESFKKTPAYARLIEKVEGDEEFAFQLASEEITTTIFDEK